MSEVSNPEAQLFLQQAIVTEDSYILLLQKTHIAYTLTVLSLHFYCHSSCIHANCHGMCLVSRAIRCISSSPYRMARETKNVPRVDSNATLTSFAVVDPAFLRPNFLRRSWMYPIRMRSPQPMYVVIDLASGGCSKCSRGTPLRFP